MASPRHRRRFVSVLLAALLAVSIAPAVGAVAPSVTLQVSGSPTTGHQVTITPVLAGFTVAQGDICRWEFRWGRTTALDQTYTGETFGGMTFDATSAIGGCGPWTFTLPWVPYPQFDVRINVSAGGGAISVGDSLRFMAAVDSTDRHILSSNLPIAQALPDTYSPIAGVPVTYTLFLIDGADTCCNPHWLARLGDERTGPRWEQAGTSPFTFTPTMAGNLIVEWHRETPDSVLDAYYDPAVKPPDTVRPTTTAPVQRIRTVATGDTIPISVAWTGADSGSGVKSYQLQQSVNGGAWTYVHLTSPGTPSTAITGAFAATIRYRVRSIDKAGNYGYWTFGPTFAVGRLSDGSSASQYTTGAWSVASNVNALGGTLHATTKAGAATSITFTGRDVGWIAERGPGHGQATVYVDGTYVGTIDLLASAAQPRMVVFARHWSTAGSHVLRIVNLATAGRPLIDIDGIAVLH
jgi:hypothetical protein